MANIVLKKRKGKTRNQKRMPNVVREEGNKTKNEKKRIYNQKR